MRRIGHLCCLGLMASAMQAQPKFEAVSIKPCPKGSGGSPAVSGTPGRLRVECQSVDTLIRLAYLRFAKGIPWDRNPRNGMITPPVPMFQLFQPLKGAAGWLKSDQFTIDAKADSPASMEMMEGPMLQAVLKDRFQLAIHTEKRELPVYDLTVAKGGAKIQRAQDGKCRAFPDPDAGPPPAWKPGDKMPPNICGGFTRNEKGGIDVFSVTMGDFCTLLFSRVERPVIDQTGLTGMYDLHLELSFAELMPNRAAGAAEEASDPGGTISAALGKLGLRLASGKAMVDGLVIDRVSRPTGELAEPAEAVGESDGNVVEVDDAERAVAFKAVIEVDADGEHLFENRHGRLHHAVKPGISERVSTATAMIRS